jgi:hypothetical protein
MQSERMNEGDTIDARLTRALERKPAVDVPAEFAARVAAQVPVRRAVALPPARYGLLAARVGMGVLLVALVVLAMRSTGHPVLGEALEWVLCAELAGLALWLSGVWKPVWS